MRLTDEGFVPETIQSNIWMVLTNKNTKMRISETPTNTIAIAARTGSEWDSVNFVLLHLTEQSIQDMKERIETLNLVKGSRNFANIRYWEDTDGWFIHGEEEIEGLVEALQEKEWVYLEITDEEEGGFGKPAQLIDSVTLKINTDNSMCFVGYGKYTSEEFWTSDVPMKRLIKDFEQEVN